MMKTAAPALETLLRMLAEDPESVDFDDVIRIIDDNYVFTPVPFVNGNLTNKAGQNNGSCKIFSFASLHQLSEAQTLNCFGDYYRVDVLQNPDADNHQNIRNFIDNGWAGIHFEINALEPMV